MQANWGLILNVLLLIGVIVAIARLMQARKENTRLESYQPTSAPVEKMPYEGPAYGDDIIAVRKVDAGGSLDFEEDSEAEPLLTTQPNEQTESMPRFVVQEELPSESRFAVKAERTREQTRLPDSSALMMFIVAKEKRQFAGYELLQTVLAAGLRFGEGHLFYRHQFTNGQGPVLCGLAAATPTGVFDLQNIGAFSVRGLCLFMHRSNNPNIDAERFAIMLETAKHLKEGLDANILDDKRQPITQESIRSYKKQLGIEQIELELDPA